MAETLENLDGVAFEPVVRMRGFYPLRGSPARWIGMLGQMKCNMNDVARTFRAKRALMSLVLDAHCRPSPRP